MLSGCLGTHSSRLELCFVPAYRHRQMNVAAPPVSAQASSARLQLQKCRLSLLAAAQLMRQQGCRQR